MVGEQFRSLLRVVPADAYLDWFASDRSHMLKPAHAEPGERAWSAAAATTLAAAQYTSPPPLYPPICGRRARDAGVAHNLTEYVSMARQYAHGDIDARPRGRGGVETAPEYGRVVDIASFVRWLAGADTTGGV